MDFVTLKKEVEKMGVQPSATSNECAIS
jgi:hypothetical protein